ARRTGCAGSCATGPRRTTSATWSRPGRPARTPPPCWPAEGLAAWHTRQMPLPVITVVGATATGKSGLSLRLAAALNGEVVNADSMQLYRGMDGGTAKLTETERAAIPHHLLDVWDVTEAASVSAYQRLARRTIADIHA